MSDSASLSFHPLTSNRFADFERLFGPRGACGGCWCMFWKLRGKAFDENTGEPARQMQKSIVDSGIVPGLLAYLDGEPVGWVAVEPRLDYPRLAHSRILKPVDDADVWSVTCFFVAKQARRQGLTVEMLKAAIDHVKDQGGKIIEGYPVDVKKDMPPVFIYHGTAAAFKKAGFVEVTRRSETRPIMRFFIGD
jgi:GNAT superfamily N-acetyltransferase